MNNQPTYGRRTAGFNEDELCKPFQWMESPPPQIAVPENGLLMGTGEKLELKICTWTYDDGFGSYDTSCGEVFCLDHEWSKKFRFCLYCGGRISLASEKEGEE